MLQIDPKSNEPIYEQIIQQIKENILKGIFQPGDKIPSVRELASLIVVNPNTISKAYQELERQQVIETIRGRGTFVCQSYDVKGDEKRMELFINDVKKLLVEAHYLGLNKDELKKIVDEIYSDFEREGE